MTGRATHGHTKGPAGTKRLSPTYLSWLAMRSRCSNPKNEKYKLYGGRGIKVCERWMNSFDNFLADMGERPPGRTLDRVKSELGYFKNNCRWASKEEQSTNRDMDKLGWRRLRTHCPDGHEFSAENIRMVKGKNRAGATTEYRRCILCDKSKRKARDDAKRGI